VGRASRLPAGRLAPDPTYAGETPEGAGETPAPLPEQLHWISGEPNTKVRTTVAYRCLPLLTVGFRWFPLASVGPGLGPVGRLTYGRDPKNIMIRIDSGELG